MATNLCTWAVRHSSGCGWVTITSLETGLTVTAPVIDCCDCFFGTTDERIIDLQHGVVAALGLDLSQGLYPVTVWRAGAASNTLPATVPDTAVSPWTSLGQALMFIVLVGTIAVTLLVAYLTFRKR